MSTATLLKDKLHVLKRNGYSLKVTSNDVAPTHVAIKNNKSYSIDDALYLTLLDTLKLVQGKAPLQYDGFKKITVGPTAPVSPSVGDIWINTNN